MAKTMIQLHFPAGKPSLEEAASVLGLDPSRLDPEFGVIGTDPRRGLFTVQVDEDVARDAKEALAKRPPHPGEGMFGEVRIAPFGPPED